MVTTWAHYSSDHHNTSLQGYPFYHLITSCFTSPLTSNLDMGGTCTVFTGDTITGSEMSSGALRSPVTSLSWLPPTDNTRDAMSMVHWWSSRKSRPSITSTDNWSTMITGTWKRSLSRGTSAVIFPRTDRGVPLTPTSWRPVYGVRCQHRGSACIHTADFTMEMTDPVSTRKVAGVPWMECDAVGLTEYTTILSGRWGLALVMLPCSAWPSTLRAAGSWDLGSGWAPAALWCHHEAPAMPYRLRFSDPRQILVPTLLASQLLHEVENYSATWCAAQSCHWATTDITTVQIVANGYQMMMSYFKGTADAVADYCTAVSCPNAPNTFWSPLTPDYHLGT